MKPRFDHKIIRPGGKRYDIGAVTDLAAKFEAIRREQLAERKRAEADAAEAKVKVRALGGKR